MSKPIHTIHTNDPYTSGIVIQGLFGMDCSSKTYSRMKEYLRVKKKESKSLMCDEFLGLIGERRRIIIKSRNEGIK